MLQSFKAAVCSVWKCGIFIMHGLGLGWSFCVPVFCRTQWMTMEQDWQNWSVCLDGRSVDPAAFQRPWGPAAIISHSFCPLPLSPAPALHRWRSFRALSKGHNKRTASWGLVLPEHSAHTHMHTADVFIRSSILLFFLSLSFLCGHIYFLTLFRSILVLFLSEGECWRNGGQSIVREIEVMSKGDWIDALPMEDE